MGVYYFLDDQVEELRRNPYVDKVSNKTITYSEAFSHHFMNGRNRGKLTTQIFREAGFIRRQLENKESMIFLPECGKWQID